MHPAPGLGLSPGMPSTLVREGQPNDISDARELAKLHVRRHMVVHGLNAREDADDIKNRVLQEELAKMSIFSVGSPTKPEWINILFRIQC
ncbi:unnamed protein product [Cylicocyclus nassatus]|uniref:Uncharacterized protein n=1 Tax=Cylicocyclus nassatus TaxID=53992 RepID=A0AA36GSF0_CYLNA|nr:unnamed protein product [Cylicocyclus nassatus]